MKQVLITMCALAMVIACTKTEVNYDAQQEIAFAPVAYNQTKAALAAGATPTTDLIISANAGTAGNAALTYSELYFDEETFTGVSGIFTSTGLYWPNVKHLSFAGVTASGGVTTDNVAIDVDANTISVTNYAQPAFSGVENDLMWFPQTAPAGKTTDAIEVTMKHACAWLEFNFIGDAVSGATGKQWKVTNVTVDGLATTATATLTATASWASHSGNQSYEVYNNSNGLTLADGTKVSTPEGVAAIVIPDQTPTTLSVTYEYTSPAGGTFTETKSNIPLTFNGTTKWAAGTKYTYDITIGATPIQIKPTAGEWETGANPTQTI